MVRLAIAGLDRLTDDAVAVTFDVPPELRGELAYDAGQHLTLVGDDGVRRAYSLCTPPSSACWRVGIKQISGGGFSEQVLPGLKVGDTLEVLPPSGRFTWTPDHDATSYGFVAAGSGITPVLSIAGEILARQADARVTIIYVNRTQRSVMFLDELADLKDAHLERLQVVHVLSREQQDTELLSGRLDAERLTKICEALVPVETVDEWYLCGPQQMVVDLREALLSAGAPVVHAELFHADPVPRAPVVELAGGDGSAKVTIRLKGRTTYFPLRPDGPAVLDAALAVLGDLPFACKGGVCGTCRALVVEGSVAMDSNWALEPDEVERGYVLTCQSHPTADEVVLDRLREAATVEPARDP